MNSEKSINSFEMRKLLLCKTYIINFFNIVNFFQIFTTLRSIEISILLNFWLGLYTQIILKFIGLKINKLNLSLKKHSEMYERLNVLS